MTLRPLSSPAPTTESAPSVEPGAGRPRSSARLRLGELLVRANVVTNEQVERALSVQRLGGGRLGSILVRLKFCTDQQMRTALAEQLGVHVVEIAELNPEPDVQDLLSTEFVRKYEVLPLRRDGRTLWVAMVDPYNLTAIDDIRFSTGVRDIVVATCTETDFRRYVERHLATRSLIEEILDGGRFYERAISSLGSDGAGDDEGDPAPPDVVHALELAGEQPPIITLCNFLLAEAVTRGASDIHIEPQETSFRVRMRLDGVLRPLITPPQRLHSAIVARFKVMAEMDISRRRVPQDGHIAIEYRGKATHFRVSTLPTVYGEKCVIRLLGKEVNLTSLDALGFDAEELTTLRRAIRRSQGLVLVTGPTGSGKTTTLHACLNDINTADVNIVTLEDPVESTIPGITHVQIAETGGVTFAGGLRSILRQDPDIVFVGEMRDPEVASIAIRAALTGHLVLSTLHTNSAVETLTRLVDMGVPGYLLAPSLTLVVAQRLLRRVCDRCAAPYTPSAAERAEFELASDRDGGRMRKGAGCPDCADTGYRGRLAAYEILPVDTVVRELIREGTTAQAVAEHAWKQGMRLLREVAVEKALSGQTTLDEVRRVCVRD